MINQKSCFQLNKGSKTVLLISSLRSSVYSNLISSQQIGTGISPEKPATKTAFLLSFCEDDITHDFCVKHQFLQQQKRTTEVGTTIKVRTR